MPVKRMIYKSFFTNLALSELTFEERLLYIGSIVFADDDGRMCSDARTLKAFIFPHDENISKENIKKMRDKIAEKKLFMIYESGGLEYLYHQTWNEYQKIRKDIYKPSVLPAPPAEISGGTEAARKRHGSGTEALQECNGSVTEAAHSIVKSSIVKNNTTKEPVKPVNEVIPEKPVKVPKDGYSVRCEPFHRVIVDYKMSHGYRYDDSIWDKSQFSRVSKSAKNLINICSGDWELATKCIDYSKNKWEQKGLSWSLSGSVINDAPEYLKILAQDKSRAEAVANTETFEKLRKQKEKEQQKLIENCEVCGGAGYLFYNGKSKQYEKKVFDKTQPIYKQLMNVKTKRCVCNPEEK